METMSQRIAHSRPLAGIQEERAAARAIRSGQLGGGEEVGRFEREMERFLRGGRATAVQTGSAALHLALLALGVRTGDRVLPVCDVAIDFTDACGTIEWLPICEKSRLPLVIGGTGQDEGQMARIRAAAKTIAIVNAANFRVGINLLLGLVGKIAVELVPQYDIESVETHHRGKLDAPSGTALASADALRIAQGRDCKGAESVVYGRHGRVGERPAGQIAIHAVRMGDIVGRHEVHFSGPGETVTLRHEAQSRDTFAVGALRAASWVIGRVPGMYSMLDVLGVT
jgi:4-hydroxy-tetrahydrodipicolinate reductase